MSACSTPIRSLPKRKLSATASTERSTFLPSSRKAAGTDAMGRGQFDDLGIGIAGRTFRRGPALFRFCGTNGSAVGARALALRDSQRTRAGDEERKNRRVPVRYSTG